MSAAIALTARMARQIPRSGFGAGLTLGRPQTGSPAKREA